MKRKKKLLPHQVLTKAGKDFFKFLCKKILHHTIGYLLLLLTILTVYFGAKAGMLDTVIKYKDAPKAGTVRRADINFRQKTATFKTLDKKTGEVYKVHEVIGVRLATIEQFEDGSVKVRARNKGFGIEPGFTAFIHNSRPRMGVDVQWAYWKRWGLSSGVGVGSRGETGKNDQQWGAYPIAFNYNLPFRLTPNTNLFLGVTNDKQATGGGTVKW